MPFLAGLTLGFSLIIAIGAQNLFVLRQGLRREHVLLVAAICSVSDAALIVAGVSGVGAATASLPWLVPVIRWAGAVFLVAYGLLAARRALAPGGQALEAMGSASAPGASGSASAPGASGSAPAPGASGVDAPAASGQAPAATRVATRQAALSAAAAALALTWLNPHVYLDTVFLLGSVAGTHGVRRWEFALGAALASFTWFFGLAYGARFLSPLLASARAWRVLDGVIAVVMVVLGVSLVLP